MFFQSQPDTWELGQVISKKNAASVTIKKLHGQLLEIDATHQDIQMFLHNPSGQQHHKLEEWKYLHPLEIAFAGKESNPAIV